MRCLPFPEKEALQVKPVYEIDKSKLQYPREVYASDLHYLLGIVSPSKKAAAHVGAFGHEVALQIAEADIERQKQAVNDRTATRSIYQSLRRRERRYGTAAIRPEEPVTMIEAFTAGLTTALKRFSDGTKAALALLSALRENQADAQTGADDETKR